MKLLKLFVFAASIVLVVPISLAAQEVDLRNFANGPGKDETVTYVDLTPYANRRFEDETPDDKVGGWTDQGSNDLRFIPKGYQYFRNVPFHVADKLAVVGNVAEPGCIALRSRNNLQAPIESEPIAVNAAAQYLYFLHCCSYGEPNVHCADYVIQYADGTSETIPLRVGREIDEWWEAAATHRPLNAVLAWKGRNPVKDDVGFYLFEWANPHPEKRIAAIVFRSLDTVTTPILIAVTASDRRIEIGPQPRVFEDTGYAVCEYRDRIRTAPVFARGSAALALNRALPIAAESEVRRARIDVSRYRATKAASVECTLGGVSKTIQLQPRQLRAQFVFAEPDVLKHLTDNKSAFQVIVKTDDPDGVGFYRYETNPNHDWIPSGEDLEHGVFAVSGVYDVTPFLPHHKLSGYVEHRPSPVTSQPAAREDAALTVAAVEPDWTRARVCLNGVWQWQPGGPKGFVAAEDNIPADGWEQIALPADVGPKVFEANNEFISAWFKKELFIPAAWKGKRIVMQFDGVADFATVFCNGRKLCYQEGDIAFEVDLSDAVVAGRNNTVCVFVENVVKGIVLRKETLPSASILAAAVPFQGHAYRIEMIRGAWDQNPDEIELLVDGRDVGKKTGGVEQVAAEGDGLYHRELQWDRSILYFSTPGNVPLESLGDRLTIRYNYPGMFRHFSKPDYYHYWNRPCHHLTGLYRDIHLQVSGKTAIDEVFVRTSVRDMRLEADVAFANVPADGATAFASVRDGGKTVLDLGRLEVEAAGAKVTFSKGWDDPTLWEPSNPYLYHLQVELKDRSGNVQDRTFTRFGFREFWIDGPDFVFNGQKPFMLQNAFIHANYLPMHRNHIRGLYQDFNQQGNINIIRWHVTGSIFPEIAEIADEMGMMLQPEDVAQPVPMTEQGIVDLDQWQTRTVDRAVAAFKRMRNSPSVVMWSADNEHTVCTQPDQVGPTDRSVVEALLRLNAAVKRMDPTRPIVNNGDSTIALLDFWKDPRVDTIDGHYVPINFFVDWQNRFGKPCTTGEESMGGPFGWTYQGESQGYLGRGEDPGPYFYKAVNAAANYLSDRIRSWKNLGLPGICPFAFTLRYNPCLLAWDGVHYGGATPDVPWPALSGEGPKPLRYGYDWGFSYNFFDPSAPNIYLRTWNAVRDSFDETPRLEPRLSPEVIVELLDADGQPIADQPVWLIPTDQPGNPYGVTTDVHGRAWFWCKSGPGTYTAVVQRDGQTHQTQITPAPPGQWLQIKTVRCRLPQ